jgi:hypothetical protein
VFTVAGGEVVPIAGWHRRQVPPPRPRDKAPAPTRGADAGDDLELLLAWWWQLPADLREALLVFARQRPLRASTGALCFLLPFASMVQRFGRVVDTE